MAPNKNQPHVLVLPEDRANSQMANGFLLDPLLSSRTIQILEEAGGWIEVLNRFESDHAGAMESYPRRFMVLLIDFDGHQERLAQAKNRIPPDLAERVFILGILTEPEDLKRNFGISYEKIGQAMAKDCREETDNVWGHALLKNNAGELDRLRQRVRPILFPSI